jgi:hypothetical protein
MKKQKRGIIKTKTDGKKGNKWRKNSHEFGKRCSLQLFQDTVSVFAWLA